MFKCRDDEDFVMPQWLDRILRVWLRTTAPLFVVGFVIFWIGFALDIKWLWSSGIALCAPILFFYYCGLGVVAVAILRSAARVSIQVTRKLVMAGGTVKAAASTAHSRGVWDRELDG